MSLVVLLLVLWFFFLLALDFNVVFVGHGFLDLDVVFQEFNGLFCRKEDG